MINRHSSMKSSFTNVVLFFVVLLIMVFALMLVVGYYPFYISPGPVCGVSIFEGDRDCVFVIGPDYGPPNSRIPVEVDPNSESL